MRKTASSQRWVREHEADRYVKMARKAGYRSRASYKLLEINERDRLLSSGMTVVDLGAAPGGWAQVAAKEVGKRGRVVALDILEMRPLENVTVIQGDFTEETTMKSLLNTLEGRHADLVISDMAPNVSGMKAVDQPRMMYMLELALDCAHQVLGPGGDFLAKAFQGEGFDQFLGEIRSSFNRVAIRKPDASRNRSREIYVLARSYGV